jgi:hypothetical protein
MFNAPAPLGGQAGRSVKTIKQERPDLPHRKDGIARVTNS